MNEKLTGTPLPLTSIASADGVFPALDAVLVPVGPCNDTVIWWFRCVGWLFYWSGRILPCNDTVIWWFRCEV